MSVPKTLRSLAAVGGTVLVALAAQPATAAQVTATVSPTKLTGPPPWRVTYKFELRTGPQTEAVRLGIGGFAAGGEPEFGPLSVSRGAEVLSQPSVAGGRVKRCPGFRGTVETHDRSEWYALVLPADTTTTVAVPVVRTRPLGLAEADLGYAARIDPPQLPIPGAPDISAVPGVSQSIPAIQPQLRVPRAVPLSLNSPKVWPGAAPYLPGAAQLGQRIPLVGRTTPHLAGQRIQLRYTTAWPARWHIIATVPVNRDGSFAYRSWRPVRSGLYTVMPYYRSQSAHFANSAPDCGTTFQLR